MSGAHSHDGQRVSPGAAGPDEEGPVDPEGQHPFGHFSSALDQPRLLVTVGLHRHGMVVPLARAHGTPRRIRHRGSGTGFDERFGNLGRTGKRRCVFGSQDARLFRAETRLKRSRRVEDVRARLAAPFKKRFQLLVALSFAYQPSGNYFNFKQLNKRS